MTAAVIFFSLNFTFVPWKSLTERGGLTLVLALGTSLAPEGGLSLNVEI